MGRVAPSTADNLANDPSGLEPVYNIKLDPRSQNTLSAIIPQEIFQPELKLRGMPARKE
jgi:hypothetical protein